MKCVEFTDREIKMMQSELIKAGIPTNKEEYPMLYLIFNELVDD